MGIIFYGLKDGAALAGLTVGVTRFASGQTVTSDAGEAGLP